MFALHSVLILVMGLGPCSLSVINVRLETQKARLVDQRALLEEVRDEIETTHGEIARLFDEPSLEDYDNSSNEIRREALNKRLAALEASETRLRDAVAALEVQLWKLQQKRAKTLNKK